MSSFVVRWRCWARFSDSMTGVGQWWSTVSSLTDRWPVTSRYTGHNCHGRPSITWLCPLSAAICIQLLTASALSSSPSSSTTTTTSDSAPFGVWRFFDCPCYVSMFRRLKSQYSCINAPLLFVKSYFCKPSCPVQLVRSPQRQDHSAVS